MNRLGFMSKLQIDFDLYACGELKALQRFDGLCRRSQHVDESFVSPHLKLFPAVFVLDSAKMTCK